MKARISGKIEPARPQASPADGERGVCGLGTCTARISRGCLSAASSFGRLQPRGARLSEVTAACAVSCEVAGVLYIPLISCILTLSSYTPYRSLSPPTCTYSTGAVRCPFSPVLLAVVASASRASLAFSLRIPCSNAAPVATPGRSRGLRSRCSTRIRASLHDPFPSPWRITRRLVHIFSLTQPKKRHPQRHTPI